MQDFKSLIINSSTKMFNSSTAKLNILAYQTEYIHLHAGEDEDLVADGGLEGRVHGLDHAATNGGSHQVQSTDTEQAGVKDKHPPRHTAQF